jgi:L-ribulokinase
MLAENKYVIGIDYGTDSVRAVLVHALDGTEVCFEVYYYPRWQKGLYCNNNVNEFRQHPLDYLEGLEITIKNCVKKAGESCAKNIVAISVDTTGSTPVAVDKTGTPLCMLPALENNANGMFILWKDHTAIKEAAEINEHVKKYATNYLQYVGGIYSSEWFWAKLLHVLRKDTSIAEHIESFVEHCDWIPFVLTGGNDIREMKRSVCSAGHKALWAMDYNGLPPDGFFTELDPLLKGFTQKLFTDTYTSDKAAGIISAQWAKKLGLPNDVVIGIGAFDCHMGAVGGEIEPYFLSKVIGTSTCDMMVVPTAAFGNKLVKGICGQVDGSIIPNMIGLEAGQSAFGDVYAWFKNVLNWPLHNLIADEKLREEASNNIIAKLSEAAAILILKNDDVMATDWLNGRRTPDANQLLKAAITNLNLGTDAPQIFKALVEATCFGSKAIMDRFISEGIPVKGIIALGGVAKKSPYIMQALADVMNMPIRVHKSEQTCAAGAAMFAATVAGLYESVEDAIKAMGQGFEKTYTPQQNNVAYYQNRFEQYKKLGNFIEYNT